MTYFIVEHNDSRGYEEYEGEIVFESDCYEEVRGKAYNMSGHYDFEYIVFRRGVAGNDEFLLRYWNGLVNY